MEEQNIPQDLRQAIGNEPTDFIIRTKRATKLNSAIILLVIGLFWTILNLFIVNAFVMQSTTNKNMGLTFSGAVVPNQTITSDSSTWDKAVGGFWVFLFLGLGILILILGIYALLAKGYWFACTPKRFISYKKGRIRSVDWREIKGGIDVKGTNENGEITIGLSTVIKNSRPIFGGTVIYMVGVKDAFALADICRKRIAENTNP